MSTHASRMVRLATTVSDHDSSRIDTNWDQIGWYCDGRNGSIGASIHYLDYIIAISVELNALKM